VNWKNIWVPLVVVGLVWWGGVSPVYVVLAAGLGGYWWHRQRSVR